MTPFATNLSELLSIGTLVLQIFILIGAVILTAVILEHPNQSLHKLSRKASDHALWIGFLISLVSVVSSLIYSNIIGFPPCELCWWQRIFWYPQAILFAVALYNEKVNKVQDDFVFLYSLIFSIIGGAIALFNYYGQMFNPDILGGCAAVGPSCAQIFFVNFGYITIPMMSLTGYVLLILLYFFRRHHTKGKV